VFASTIKRIYSAVLRWLWLLVILFAGGVAGIPAEAADDGLPQFSWGVWYGAMSGPGIDRYMRRLQARTENTLTRFGRFLADTGVLWLWMIGSAVIFLLVTAVASVADLRMFNRRPHRLKGLWDELRFTTRLFFRVLIDRRTPMVARLPVALGLCYWLVPLDLIADTTVFPGFIDDFTFAILGARAFTYFCPESVIVRNAQNLVAGN